jgi:hypothetical protein
LYLKISFVIIFKKIKTLKTLKPLRQQLKTHKMFTQRKTNSFDLVGTNARNSNASMQSEMQKHYGENMIGRMSLEQFDQEISQHLEQVFRPFNPMPLL